MATSNSDVEESEAIADYKSSLNDLAFNSKPQISMLTMLADDYKDTPDAPNIVRVIDGRLHEVSPEKKLPLLYLMDSICKNVGGIYCKLFTQSIVSNFCHAFEKADEKTRLSLYKLRQTWSDVFSPRKLYAIDTRIKKEYDPAWPVTAPKPDLMAKPSQTSSTGKGSVSSGRSRAADPSPKQLVHINPRFLNDSRNSTDTTFPAQGVSVNNAESEMISVQLIEKQKELLHLQKQKVEWEILAQKRKLEEQARQLREKEQQLNMKEKQLQRSPSQKRAKKRGRNNRSPSPSPDHMQKRSPKWTKNSSTRNVVPPNRGITRSPPRVSNWPNVKSQSPSKFKRQKSPLAELSSRNQLISNSSVLSHNKISRSPPIPTTIPAPGVLASGLTIATNGTGIVKASAILNPLEAPHADNNFTSGQTNMQQMPTTLAKVAPEIAVGWGQDRDYRREFDAAFFEADKRRKQGDFTSQDDFLREMQRMLYQSSNIGQATQVPPKNSSHPQQLNMIVDGEERLLFYLNETIPVVLMKANCNSSFDELINRDPVELDPRLTSFEGNPTNVYIDSERGGREFVLLEFNNQPKTFFHNEMEQRIQFGGPAKEIILNGRAYAAKFGGPPIVAMFNGDTTQFHTLRLDGPPPRVKLSDEKRVDLWNQIVLNATKPPSPPPPPPPVLKTPPEPIKPKSSEPNVDINNLLKSLVAQGLIGQSAGSNSPTDDNKMSPQVNDEDSQPLPPEEEVKLIPESLKIHRPSLVAALYNGIQCTNCSLRFTNKADPKSGGKTKYAKHLDWHFRQNRKDKTRPSASSIGTRRSWFYSLDLWFQFKEVTDEEETAISNVFDSIKDSEKVEEVEIKTVVSSDDDALNHCNVCSEKFELIWCEDSEEWRLKNAVSHADGKNYHPLCLADVMKVEQRNDMHSDTQSEDESHKVAAKDEDHPDAMDDSECMEPPDLESERPSKEEITEESDDVKDEAIENPSESELVVTANIDPVDPVADQREIDSISETAIPSSDDLGTEAPLVDVTEYEIPSNSEPLGTIDGTDTSGHIGDLSSEFATSREATTFNVPASQESEKVVVQQKGIVFNLRASTLQPSLVAPLPQPDLPKPSADSADCDLTVKGHEVSALCTLM